MRHVALENSAFFEFLIFGKFSEHAKSSLVAVAHPSYLIFLCFWSDSLHLAFDQDHLQDEDSAASCSNGPWLYYEAKELSAQHCLHRFIDSCQIHLTYSGNQVVIVCAMKSLVSIGYFLSYVALPSMEVSRGRLRALDAQQHPPTADHFPSWKQFILE